MNEELNPVVLSLQSLSRSLSPKAQDTHRTIRNTKGKIYHDGSKDKGLVQDKAPDPLGELANVSIDPRSVSTAQTPAHNSNLRVLIM